MCCSGSYDLDKRMTFTRNKNNMTVSISVSSPLLPLTCAQSLLMDGYSSRECGL